MPEANASLFFLPFFASDFNLEGLPLQVDESCIANHLNERRVRGLDEDEASLVCNGEWPFRCHVHVERLFSLQMLVILTAFSLLHISLVVLFACVSSILLEYSVRRHVA